MAFLNYEGLKRYDKKTKEYIEDIIKKTNNIDADKLAAKGDRLAFKMALRKYADGSKASLRKAVQQLLSEGGDAAVTNAVNGIRTTLNAPANFVRGITKDLIEESGIPVLMQKVGNFAQGKIDKALAKMAEKSLQHSANVTDMAAAMATGQVWFKVPSAIKFNLKEFRQKQTALKSLQNKQKRNLEILNQDKNIYSKKLADIKKQQDEMRKTLENLQILAAKPQVPAKKQTPTKEQNRAKTDKVRMIGSSYQAGNVKRYSGAKTIAPLDKFSVKQKFGDYVDPVYNIKIFNESVVLRSATTDARVKNVLAGTIVFAKETPVLDKVVIVENGNGIHTIYAHLDKIAPTIKVGQKVKKGYVIGRVKQDLTFEVTQKNYHINPLELIAMN